MAPARPLARPRIHIMGGSGCGVTTLGAAVAAETGIAHHDVDDIFWVPSDPPFQEVRPMAERQALLVEAATASGQWVLTGSCDGWGDVIQASVDLVVFLTLPTELRLERLHARELTQFGAEAIAPGGVMHDNVTAFMEWAAAYDTAGSEQRSRARHEAWLATHPSPVLRIDGDTTVADRLARVLAAAR